VSHAFFKDKLIVMLEQLKHYTVAAQQKWLDEIRASNTASTQMDMSREILYIMQKFLMHVVIGENIESTELSILAREKATDPYTPTKMCMSEAAEAAF